MTPQRSSWIHCLRLCVAAAFKFGSSDDDEEVEIPSSKTTPRGPTVDEDDDEFEFYT